MCFRTSRRYRRMVYGTVVAITVACALIGAALIERFVAVGTTKFVVLPLDEPTDAEAWTDHLEQAAAALLPLERTLP